MVAFGQKLIVFEQNWLFDRAKWLYSDKSGCIPSKVVVFGQKWLYLVKSGCILAKGMNSAKMCCIRAKWWYSGKVVLFWQKLL